MLGIDIQKILQFADNNCNINMDAVKRTMEITIREEVVAHSSLRYWHGRDGKWYVYIPDITRSEKRRKVKRSTEEKIKEVVYQYELHRNDGSNNKVSNNITDTKLSSGDTTTFRSIDEMSFYDLYLEFMDHKKHMISSRTVRRMMTDWAKYYAPAKSFISLPFRKITKIDIDDFLNTVVNNNDLTNKAFYNMCGIVKQTFEYAVDKEYIDKSPYRVKINKKNLKRTTKNKNREEVFLLNEQPLILEEMERRFQNNPSNTAPLGIMLTFEIGVRSAELLALCYSDIDNGKIHVHKQVVELFDTSDVSIRKSLGQKVVEHAKSLCGDRYIPLSKRALEIIERIKKQNRINGEPDSDYIFIRDGKIMPLSTLDKQLRDGCNYINIPVRSMHKIRKTFASNLYARHVPISTIKNLLGHVDEATTYKHYIFDVTLDETNENAVDAFVLQALDGKNEEKVPKGTQNIIPFEKRKRAEKPVKSGIPL